MGIADVVAEEAGMTYSYRTMPAAAPGFGRAIDISLDPTGRPDPADVARARQQGHVVVRTEPDPPPAAARTPSANRPNWGRSGLVAQRTA